MKICNHWNHFKSLESIKGSALMITAVVVMTMVTVSVVLLNDVITHSKVVNSYENNYLLRYAVDAGLEQVKYQSKTSAYTGTRNVWLMTNSSTAGTPAINDLMINNVAVDVTLYDLTNGWYRAVSTATKNYESYRVAVDIRESIVNSLFKYAYASDAYMGDMHLRLNGFADAIYGDVHTNARAVFGGRYYLNGVAGATGVSKYGIPVYGNVTAVNGVGTLYQSNEDPTWVEGDLVGGSVSGTIDGHVSLIAFPTLNQIVADLQPLADDYPLYFIHSSNPLYAPYGDDSGGDGMAFNTRVTLLGTQIQIEFFSNLTGNVIHTTTLPLPAHKLLWLDGGTSVSGEINGRLTIAAPTGIGIGGNIRYIDNEGDRAYVLKKNGVVVDPNSTGTESWTATNGYTYEVNPAHNPAVPCNLTLQGGVGMGLGLTASTTYNMEVHATTLSTYWQCGYGPNWSKGNFRMVGSVVTRWGRNDGDSDHHFNLSAEMIHDPNLLTNPPEWYPTSGSSNIPSFFSWRRY